MKIMNIMKIIKLLLFLRNKYFRKMVIFIKIIKSSKIIVIFLSIKMIRILKKNAFTHRVGKKIKKLQ